MTQKTLSAQAAVTADDSSDGPAYRSFWMGGFEGADHINALGEPLDMADATGHTSLLLEDFERMRQMGLHTVRESIGWRLSETGRGQWNFDRARRVARAAEQSGLQVIWTFMHYGTPGDVNLFDDSFIERFAQFAGEAAAALREFTLEAPVYNLINEIGFLSWAVSETNLIAPYRGDPSGRGERTIASGYAVKRRLVKGVLAGMKAVRRVDPRARFLHVEPMVHVIAPRNQPRLRAQARQICSYQWQVWDMLEGRADAELGGSPAALDLIGINHYHDGQWEAGTEERLHWSARDPRRRPLSQLLQENWQRYRRPLIVAETSHVGVGRAEWLDEVASEVRTACEGGVPIQGVCLYPVVDRFDWNDTSHWHHSGLWDVDDRDGIALADRRLGRLLDAPYAAALARWQAQLPRPSCSALDRIGEAA